MIRQNDNKLHTNKNNAKSLSVMLANNKYVYTTHWTMSNIILI